MEPGETWGYVPPPKQCSFDRRFGHHMFSERLPLLCRGWVAQNSGDAAADHDEKLERNPGRCSCPPLLDMFAALDMFCLCVPCVCDDKHISPHSIGYVFAEKWFIIITLHPGMHDGQQTRNRSKLIVVNIDEQLGFRPENLAK